MKYKLKHSTLVKNMGASWLERRFPITPSTGGHLRRLLLSVASGLTCGRERPQKVLWIVRKGDRRCVYYFSDLYLELLGVPSEPDARFARSCALLVPVSKNRRAV